MSKTFNPDTDNINDLVASIPSPTKEQIEAGKLAIDHYYDGTKDAPFEGSVAMCYRAMRALEPGWQPIDTAPTGNDDFFLVGCDDPRDDRSPFVVRGSIFKSARKSNTPGHLSLGYLTHWQPLPAKPSR